MSVTPLPLLPFPRVRLLADETSRSPARDTGQPRRTPSHWRHETPVLVVDDDDSIRDMLHAVLTAEGYAVRVARDGAAGLVMVDAELPSVVLLDMRMRKVDGRAFARLLRERGLRVPILVMTSSRDASKAAAEVEADGFLAKPFEVDELLTTVSRFRREPPN